MASPDPAAADPFFRVLRERHPDVDVVLLPPTRPRPADPEAWTGDPEAVADDAVEALRVLGVALGTDLPLDLRFWKHHDEAAQQHLTVPTSFPAPGREVAELRRVGQALIDLGWQARPLERQARPTLEALRDGHRLVAHVVEGGIDLVLTSRPVADSAWTDTETTGAGGRP
ncbi:hypothetical protein [Nocardioides sp. zg-1230]|uniref:hypothetical protein n=1 Tax=Nocardioides sp. zg-1230 TaxID=2736601 RepID=UPI0015577D4C|nr:hypothetical protein [Nocardioides sp. zg-1230]NPC43995.1 hypothetical protein [Nocardioides sp. zg-1230]